MVSWDLLVQNWNDVTGWTTLGAGTSDIDPAGQLRQIPDNATYVNRYRDIGALPTTYTAQFRLKIDDFGDSGLWTHDFYDGVHRVNFQIFPTYIHNADSAQSINVVTTEGIFYIWRLVIDSAGGHIYVYRDEEYLGDLGAGLVYAPGDGTVYATSGNGAGDNFEAHEDYLYIATGLYPWNSDSEDLPAEFIIRQPALVDLPGEFVVRQAYEELLPARFLVRHPHENDLFSQLCVKSLRVSQDLDLWVEYDPQNELDHDCNDSWWQDVPNLRQDTALMKTVGGGGLGSDFFHELELNVFDVEKSGNGQTERICAWAGHLSMVVQDFYGLNDFEIAALVVMATDTDDEYQLKLIEKGGNEDTMATKWPNYQSRYIVIYKEGTKLIALAYQDAGHSILEDRAEITLSGDLDFQYVSMPMSYGGPIAAETSSGYIDPVFGSFEQLLGAFEVRHVGVPVDLLARFEVGQSSEDLPAQFDVRRSASVELHAAFEGQSSVDLIANFHIQYRRIFGENWQRKSWFVDPYYWRSYYSLALDSFVFEYIHKTGLTGNVWTENVAARIDASGFDVAALEADFSVRGPRSGLPVTIVYSDGRDVWVAESDEASVLGWAWQNTTQVFDATAPDWYRYVGIFADRRTPTSKLYVVAVYYDDAPGGVQYVRFREQTNGLDITAWDAIEDVSNTANTDNILGVMGRSMGSTGVIKKEVIVVYKEGIALRSRYHTDVGWQAIQDIDTTAEAEKSLACFDAEHYELAGDNCIRLLYIDADNTVRSANRLPGIASVWGNFVTLDASITEHDNVGIVNVDSIQFLMWQDGHNIGYRQYRCNPDTWWPALVNAYNEFRPDSEAVITTTSQTEQIQGPDDIAAGDAVAINWVGLIGGAAGIGWGVLQAASVETLPAEFVIRRSSSLDLPASFEGQTSEDLLCAFTVRQETSVDLPAEFLSAQGDEDLPCAFVVRHTATLDLKASFDAQASLNIPAEFVIRRSSLLNLPAEFWVLQGLRDLPAEFFVENGDTVDLPAEFIVRHAGTPVELPAEFVVRNIGSGDLLASFEAQTSVELPAEFSVRHPTSVDLLAGFRVRHLHTGTGIIIANDPAAFFNYSENVGTGFLSRPHYSRNTKVKVTGRDSLRIDTYYIAKRFDYIQFGWKYRNPVWGEDTWPGTYKAALNRPAEFVIRHSSSRDLPAQFYVLAQKEAFNDLAAEFYVMVDRWTLIAEETLLGPTDEVNFSGLDLVANKEYVLTIGSKNVAGLVSYIRWAANDDLTGSNYRFRYTRSGSSAVGGNDNRLLSIINSNMRWWLEIRFMKAPDGRLVFLGLSANGSISALDTISGSYEVDLANLTKLTFMTETLVGARHNGFDTDSVFKLWGYVA